MNKTILRGGEYVAPELEVVSTVVEQGFTASVSLASLDEDEFGTY